MPKILRNIFICVLIIIIIVAFSSSYASLNIDNLAYVFAIGIDASDENNIEVTFEFSTTTGSSESGSTEKSKPIINSVTASSLSSAINLMDSYLEKEINLSHCKAIIFSEEIAYNGISDEIYTLINNTQVRPSTNIIISKCKAKYYIEQTKPELESSVSKYFEILADSSRYTGFIPDSTIGGFFNSLICKDCDPYAILGGVNQSESQNTTTNNNEKDFSVKANDSSIQGEVGTENIGLAVFKNDRIVGELDALETICFMTLKNDINRFLISVPDPVHEGNYIDIYFMPYDSTNIKVDTSSASPYIKVKVKLSGKIYSMSEDASYLQPEILHAISSSCNSYLEYAISDFLYKTSKDFHCDIIGFGQHSLSNFYTTRESENYKWLESYKNAFFDVKVDTSVESGMLITET